MHFTGIIIAVSTFLIIGFFHPIVIKAEYHTGTRLWWLFLIIGVACIAGALFIENDILSALIGVLGASSLWSIGELFSQKKRVEKGWFPMNPRRRHEYSKIDKNETLCPVHHGRSIYAVDDED
jgi:drug/metabolite transporter (DMT)-like permease